MERSVQCAKCAAEFAKSVGRAEQVSLPKASDLDDVALLIQRSSASPLNGEAASLHEKHPEEYARKVLARHQDIDD